MKRKMRSAVAVLLASILLCGALTACGKDSAENTESDDKESEDAVGTTISSINFSNSFDLDDIEAYDSVPNTTIDFSIDDFKSENSENLDESDMAKIDDLTEAELQAIATKKANMLDELTVAFNNAGISVEINETSGEISLDSSVLFGGDSAVLSSEGKAFLNKFISTYTSVVFSDEFDGFISKIYVEGHTAPVSGSTYESGLPLSEERANKVKDYCLSSETGISNDHISELTAVLKAVGLSNSKPVKDSDGNVDMAASRRVSFRFLINLD